MKPKTVFITGISRGIGNGLAKKFLEEGYYVIGTSTAGKGNIKNENLKSLRLNLSSEKSINKCVEDFSKLNRKIDILINNAGVLLDEFETLLKINPLRESLEVNLIGTVSLTEKLLHFMNKKGTIINISSSAGSFEHTRYTKYPAYKISKAALNMYTKVLSIRLKKRKILVASIHPGWVKTDMGGAEANLKPEEAATNIYNRIISLKETGQFWFGQDKFPW
ncbi:MAG: SDR family NAD(P)-dependent oxidoreductase [Nanoarchaeota archaeon]|nr:SDR family NAD(P)-dependent oxidoreductase [Nanoarchaeota archaeon]